MRACSDLRAFVLVEIEIGKTDTDTDTDTVDLIA
jgi:hypothetical protein